VKNIGIPFAKKKWRFENKAKNKLETGILSENIYNLSV
jgi:hypothetical protein